MLTVLFPFNSGLELNFVDSILVAALFHVSPHYRIPMLELSDGADCGIMLIVPAAANIDNFLPCGFSQM